MLRDLRIGQRLAVGFGAVLGMTLMVAVLAQYRVGTIASSLATINDVNNVKLSNALGLRSTVRDRAIALRDAVMAEPEELNGWVATIGAQGKTYADAAARLEAMNVAGQLAAPEEQALLAQIKAAETLTMPLIAEVIRTLVAGQVQPAQAALKQRVQPAMTAWLGPINKLMGIEEAANRRIGEDVRAIANGFFWLILGICVVALLVGSGIAYWSLGAIRPLGPLTKAMSRLAAGDVSLEVPSLGRRDEVGHMAAAVEVFKAACLERARLEAEALDFQRTLDSRLKQTEAAFAAAGQAQKQVVEHLAAALSGLADGDLRVRLTAAVAADYETLKTDFNAAVDSLGRALTEVANNTSAIRSGSSEITQASDDLSRRTEQQAASLEETAAALHEITTAVSRTAEGAIRARSVVGEARADAERSGEVASRVGAAMNGIETSSRQIGTMVSVIDEIAFQTNLLALNAGVEAARAGDAGRGFAVVASEVRGLAQRSAEAARQIKGVIHEADAQVKAGVELVGATGKALARIVSQVSEINTVVVEIAASAAEQARGLAEVNTAVGQMDQVTQQNAAMVEQSTAAAHGLSQQAESLGSLVARFKLETPIGTPAISSRRDTRPEKRA